MRTALQGVPTFCRLYFKQIFFLNLFHYYFVLEDTAKSAQQYYITSTIISIIEVLYAFTCIFTFRELISHIYWDIKTFCVGNIMKLLCNKYWSTQNKSHFLSQILYVWHFKLRFRDAVMEGRDYAKSVAVTPPVNLNQNLYILYCIQRCRTNRTKKISKSMYIQLANILPSLQCNLGCNKLKNVLKRFIL